MRLLVLLLLGLMAMTASFSGLLLLVDPEGGLLELDPLLLAETPFPDYRLPGFILAVIVGGSSLAAFCFQLALHPKAFGLTVLAGMIMCGWIAGQALLLEEYNLMQVLYFLAGLVVVLIGFRLKGKALF